MKRFNPTTKLAFGAALAAGAFFAASSATAACSVWWQSKCCTVAGVTGVGCGTPPNTWRCEHNIVSNPAVGALSAAAAGWSGPWGLGFETCTYNVAACGPGFGQCIYALPAANKACADVKPPMTPPNCP
jgi:hypothetical protein